jgi:hypothetical protein
MKNLTYSQLIELAPKDRPFQIEVESNAKNNGGKQVLWANIDKDGDLSTQMLTQDSINWVDYSYSISWKDTYTGTFTLIDPRYQKPEVLKVGQKVRIMESARDIGEYGDMIGKIMTIHNARSDAYGVHYTLDNKELGSYLEFPHYCVMPVEEEGEEQPRIPTPFDDMIEEFEALFIKAQEIVDKYKK